MSRSAVGEVLDKYLDAARFRDDTGQLEDQIPLGVAFHAIVDEVVDIDPSVSVSGVNNRKGGREKRLTVTITPPRRAKDAGPRRRPRHRSAQDRASAPASPAKTRQRHRQGAQIRSPRRGPRPDRPAQPGPATLENPRAAVESP